MTTTHLGSHAELWHETLYWKRGVKLVRSYILIGMVLLKVHQFDCTSRSIFRDPRYKDECTLPVYGRCTFLSHQKGEEPAPILQCGCRRVERLDVERMTGHRLRWRYLHQRQ